MVIDERSRHALHTRLRELLGDQEAATLMEYLPPVGWADVATKRDLDGVRVDLDRLRTEMGGDLERFRLDLLAEMHREIAGLQWRLVTWVSGLNIGLVGLAFAAAKLA